jgi:hypothetical protein
MFLSWYYPFVVLLVLMMLMFDGRAGGGQKLISCVWWIG